MAKLGKGMAAPIEQGHADTSKAPGLKKGQFQQVGTFVDEMNSLEPKAISVNHKTGKLQNGE